MTTSPAEHLPRCRHPKDKRQFIVEVGDTIADGYQLCDCGHRINRSIIKRGRNNRSRGNRAELSVARKYGGEKVGQLGLPEDIRGTEYRTQVKTHQRPAPAEWRKAFSALEAVTDNRTPRLIVRFLQLGVPADDYIIIRGRDWLDRFGTDEEETTRDAA
jgi:hypothetical protein